MCFQHFAGGGQIQDRFGPAANHGYGGLAQLQQVGADVERVAAVHPAFEVPDSRFVDFARAGEAQLLADDACCGRFVFGTAAPDGWRHVDLATLAVQATVTGADGTPRLAREGSGFVLTLREGWLKKLPLTAAALDEEQRHWLTVGHELKIRTETARAIIA